MTEWGLWTEAEISFLRECAHAKIQAEKIAPLIGRTVAAVKTKRNLLNLPAPNYKCFTSHRSPVSVATIQRTVAEHFKLPADEMRSDNRKRDVAHPRQVAMFFAREVAQKSYPDIGRLFGNRDHTTVIHAVRQVQSRRNADEQFAAELETLNEQISAIAPVEKSAPVAFLDCSTSA